jgi:transcriptional regulator with XRE-family HTH domain
MQPLFPRVAHRPRAPAALEDLRVNLIVERAKARFSQEDLAARSGVGRATISRIERAAGDVGVEVVDRLAAALGTTVHDLFAPTAEVDQPDDAELARRAEAPDDEFIDADAVLVAVDEAAGRLERYSRAGRPPVAR